MTHRDNSAPGPPAGLPAELRGIWAELVGQVRSDIGAAGLEALCVQVLRMRDARDRVTNDGLVVQDAKGNAVPHPALEIEKRAQNEIRVWLQDYGVVT